MNNDKPSNSKRHGMFFESGNVYSPDWISSTNNHANLLSPSEYSSMNVYENPMLVATPSMPRNPMNRDSSVSKYFTPPSSPKHSFRQVRKKMPKKVSAERYNIKRPHHHKSNERKSSAKSVGAELLSPRMKYEEKQDEKSQQIEKSASASCLVRIDEADDEKDLEMIRGQERRKSSIAQMMYRLKTIIPGMNGTRSKDDGKPKGDSTCKICTETQI